MRLTHYDSSAAVGLARKVALGIRSKVPIIRSQVGQRSVETGGHFVTWRKIL